MQVYREGVHANSWAGASGALATPEEGTVGCAATRAHV